MHDLTRVFKYTLPIDDYVWLDVPVGAQPLTVQMQGETPQLWMRVDPEKPMEKRGFRIAGTGHPLASDVGAWIGTFQLHGGALIFHVFEGTDV